MRTTTAAAALAAAGLLAGCGGSATPARPASGYAAGAATGSVQACTTLVAGNWNRADPVPGTDCHGLSASQVQQIVNRLLACKAHGACAGLSAEQIRLVSG